MQGLELPEPVAVTLVRRGYRTVEEARAFLEASETHDPFAFDSMGERQGDDRARGRRRADDHRPRRLRLRRRLGDRDPGARAAAAHPAVRLVHPGSHGGGVRAHRATGSSAWPREGPGLLITVDCGIACPEEVRGGPRGRHGGDRHRPSRARAEPFRAARSSTRASAAIRSASSAPPASRTSSRPRCSEPRRRSAISTWWRSPRSPIWSRCAARTARWSAGGSPWLGAAPALGFRALCEAASIAPERLDEGDLAFRLGPRINAAGRLYRADAGVELMLTSDEERARAIAAELNRANSERRTTERDGGRGGGGGARRAARRAWPRRPALVLAGTDWHPGVVGIAASRLAERHFVPTVLIGLDSEGRGRGSGRSIPGFDLLGALDACGEHLTRYGGHRAAAGLEIEAGRIDAFREAFVAHASEVMDEDRLGPTEAIDAVVGGESLGHDVARGARAPGAVRHGEPRGSAARCRRCASATCGRWATATSTRGSGSRAAPARRSGWRSASTGELAESQAGRPGRRLGEARAERVERGGRAPRRAGRALQR